MDGYAFLKALARSSYSSIPTIAVTSSSEAGTEQAILAIGAWDYVTKPYEPLTLLTRLKNVIQRSQFYLLNQMKRLYEYDSLTGIYNRSFFFVKTRELLDAHRDQTFALLHFDINYFQVYNAFWGEDGGDKLLVFLANFFIKEAARYSDCTYGRINADVFCLCIPYDPKDVQRLINAVDQALVAFNPEYRVSAAWGIYVIEDYGQGVDRMKEKTTSTERPHHNRLATALIILTNLLFVAGIIVASTFFTSNYRHKINDQNVGEITNVNASSARVASTFLEYQNKTVDDQVLALTTGSETTASKTMTLSEALKELGESNSRLDSHYELVGTNSKGTAVALKNGAVDTLAVDYSTGYDSFKQIFTETDPGGVTILCTAEFTDYYTKYKSFALYRHGFWNLFCLLSEKGWADSKRGRSRSRG